MSVRFVITDQPLEVENIVATVSMLLSKDEQLIVVRPDYTKPVGVGDNLWRTTLFLSKQEHPVDIPMVHISNMPHDNGDTRVVIFTDMEEYAKKTLYYQTPAYMATKEYLVSNIGCRDVIQIAPDIAEYLKSGKLPA